MGDEHGGFCCAECADAAMRGVPSSCDGGSCRTGTSGVDVNVSRQDAIKMMNGRMALMPSTRGSKYIGAAALKSRELPYAEAAPSEASPMSSLQAAPSYAAYDTKDTGAATAYPSLPVNPTEALARMGMDCWQWGQQSLASKVVGAGLVLASVDATYSHWKDTERKQAAADLIGRIDVYCKRLRESLPSGPGFASVADSASVMYRGAKDTGSTGCACSMPSTVSLLYADPLLMKFPNTRGTAGIGRLAMVAPRWRGTGAVSLTYPDGLPGSTAERNWLNAVFPGEIDAEAAGRTAAYAETLRQPGENDTAWRARVDAYYRGFVGTGSSSLAARRWIDAMRLSGRLGGAAPSASGSSSPPATTTRPPTTTAPGATTTQNQQAVINGVVSAVASAGGTVLALVREANQHDSEVRAREAEDAAVRIARNDSREAMLIAAVREATAAGFDAQTALRMLRNGDRAGAITQLSAAQGKLAGAVGTATAFAGSTALTSAISSATASVGAAATEIDRGAPTDLPVNNPLNTRPDLPIAGPTPWYKQPITWAVGAAGVVLAVLAGRR